MDDFSKFAQMKLRGASPQDVYQAGKQDGLDEITCIRILRNVFGLTLRQTKEVICGSGECWSGKQNVVPGGIVYWEGMSKEGRFFLMQARVTRISGKAAELEEQKKFLVTKSGLEDVVLDGPIIASREVSFLELPLSERLEEFFQYLRKSEMPSTFQGEMDKKAV